MKRGCIVRTWTPSQLRTLRRRYGKEPVRGLAARLGKTESAVKSKAKKLGVQDHNRFLTEAEREAIRQEYGKTPTAALAERLGLKPACLQRTASKMGLTRPTPRITEEDLGRIRKLHGQGWSDTEIAALLGRERHAVSNHRKRMGLPEH